MHLVAIRRKIPSYRSQKAPGAEETKAKLNRPSRLVHQTHEPCESRCAFCNLWRRFKPKKCIVQSAQRLLHAVLFAPHNCLFTNWMETIERSWWPMTVVQNQHSAESRDRCRFIWHGGSWTAKCNGKWNGEQLKSICFVPLRFDVFGSVRPSIDGHSARKLSSDQTQVGWRFCECTHASADWTTI